jgi:hypothetical protein
MEFSFFLMNFLCNIVTKHEHERSIVTSEYLQNPPLLWFGAAAPIMIGSDSLLVADVLLSAAFRLRCKNASNGAKG